LTSIFIGNPGISVGIQSSLTAIIGKPVTIPIYDENGGNGANARYRVVALLQERSVDRHRYHAPQHHRAAGGPLKCL
jgi:hypothetical protein